MDSSTAMSLIFLSAAVILLARSLGDLQEDVYLMHNRPELYAAKHDLRALAVKRREEENA